MASARMMPGELARPTAKGFPAVFGGAVMSGTSSSLEPPAGKPFFPKASGVKLVRLRYPFDPGVACQLAG